jgi:putative acetyltransferase
MIRKYKDTDVEDLLDVWFQASSLAHPFLDSAFIEKEKANVREVYLPNTDTWVFKVKDQIGGFISMIENEVGAIFVRPEFQGGGIGTRLMNHVSGFNEELVVEVFERNVKGMSFYEQYGFEQVKKHVHEETGQVLVRMRFSK